MSENIVIADSISFAYAGHSVLDKVSLTIKQDDFLAIVGPNGGGKSTFLKIMLGLLKPQTGTLTVFDKSAEKGRRFVGYMPQFKAQTQNYPITVLDVVLMGSMTKNIFRWYSASDREKAMACLKDVQAETLAQRPFSQLSGGQQQRALLARALMCDPKLLILDEPTCSIDQPTGQHFFELLTQLNSKMAVVMVSHDLAAVSHSAKSIVCLNKTLTNYESNHAYCRHDND